MATENKVTAIGTTTVDGETKVRYTADLATRTKSWQRAGVDAEFISLPEPMERLDALRYLASLPEFQSEERAKAIMEQILLKESYLRRDERRAKRQAKKSQESSVATISLAEIRQRKKDVAAV